MNRKERRERKNWIHDSIPTNRSMTWTLKKKRLKLAEEWYKFANLQILINLYFFLNIIIAGIYFIFLSYEYVLMRFLW